MFRGPVVSCTGSWGTFRQNGCLSAKAQRLESPLRVLWNTKYSPSDVQLPQHSCGGVFQLANSSGCGFVPSARASHSEDTPPTKAAVTVKRMRDPSGESLIPLGSDPAVTTTRSRTSARWLALVH